MSLRFAILAALLEGEASGYGLSKRFGVTVANFWPATQQQLYRELDRLQSEGYVEGRVVEQESRPNKRVFSPTDAGLEALAEFVATPARPVAVRDELYVKVQALDIGDPAAVVDVIAQRVALSREKLAQFDRLRERLLDGRDEDDYLRTTERVGPYLTLMRGRAFERENIRWGERALRILADRATD